jgi:hypothetical protein
LLVDAGLVADANVLVDFVLTDRSVLTIASLTVGPVIVTSPVLDEIAALDTSTCERLGLRVAEPTVDQLLAAAAQQGRLSFTDRLSMIVARDGGWRCITNDPRLRASCEAATVSVLSGTTLLNELVGAGRLAGQRASALAAEMHEINPLHVTVEMVAEVSRHAVAHGTSR